MIHVNVAAKIPCLYKNGTRAEIIWLAEEIKRFCAAAPRPLPMDAPCRKDGSAPRRPDRPDMDRSRTAAHQECHAQEWTPSQFAMTPVTPDLRSLLDELATRPRRADANTVLVNSRGKGAAMVPPLTCPFPRGTSHLTRGCSSMVEQQLPKLTTGVRFPSPAPGYRGGSIPPPTAAKPRCRNPSASAATHVSRTAWSVARTTKFAPTLPSRKNG